MTKTITGENNWDDRFFIVMSVEILAGIWSMWLLYVMGV